MGGHTQKGGQLFQVHEEIADEGENHCTLILTVFRGKPPICARLKGKGELSTRRVNLMRLTSQQWSGEACGAATAINTKL